MSGFAPPVRTTMLIGEWARWTLLATRSRPRLPSSSAAPPSSITTSAVSPRRIVKLISAQKAACRRGRGKPDPCDIYQIVGSLLVEIVDEQSQTELEGRPHSLGLRPGRSCPVFLIRAASDCLQKSIG